jgi:hypothetical protein
VAKNRCTLCAMTPRRPSTAASSSLAPRDASRSPSSRASACAARRADVADAEPDEQLRQRPARRRSIASTRAAPTLADPLERDELLDGERVEVGRVGEQPRVTN